MKKNNKLAVAEIVSQDNIKSCISTLEHLVNNSDALTFLSDDERVALLKAAGQLSRPDRDEIRKRNADVRKSRRQALTNSERQARAATGIRAARKDTVFKAPMQLSGKENNKDGTDLVLNSPRNCYICKKEFTQLHFFYDAMCPECAEFNY
ncbi:MAG: hypothetical protein E4H13_08795, partial [Calditrichales bacterium]